MTEGEVPQKEDANEADADYYSDKEVDRMGRGRKVRGLDMSIRGSFRRDFIVFFVIVIIVLVIITIFLMVP